MERDFHNITLDTPEIMEAREVSLKLLQFFRQSTDLLLRKAIKKMVYDALEYQTELILKTRAKQEVKNFHELFNPVINPN